MGENYLVCPTNNTEQGCTENCSTATHECETNCWVKCGGSQEKIEFDCEGGEEALKLKTSTTTNAIKVEVMCEHSNAEPSASAAKFLPDQLFTSILFAHMIS